MSLPAHVHAQASRILDGAARRILAEQMNDDTAGAASGVHNRPLHADLNERTALLERKPVPVLAGPQDDSGMEAG